MRRRILTSCVLVTLLAVGLFGVPLALAVRSRYLDQTELELERAADLAATNVPADITHEPVAMPQVESSRSLALYDPSGRRVSGQGPAAADPLVRGALSGSEATGSAEGDLVVAVPVIADGAVIGALRVAEPADLTAGLYRQAWLVMAGLAAFALLASALVARSLASRLADPISDLRDGAVRLGDGDFTSRVPRSGITEVDEVAEALAATAQRLDKLLERERAFSAEASHQLRTPLTSLRLAIEREMDTPAADPREVLHSTMADLDRLEATVESLLVIARGRPNDRGPLDLDGLLDRASERAVRVLAASGRRLDLSLDAHGPPAHASPAAIGQALDALVDNAVEHGAGTVTVGTHDLSGAIVISVSDDGPGVLDRRTAFAGHAGASDAHGIGLALARRLVEAERGRLLLRSLGPHPVFEIVLPAGSTEGGTSAPPQDRI